ncbi:DUF1616 domain-containing protein [Halobacterium wangiae]|uniref:DUF1616 domain-containing protein n=1 Tax=Halobacterium wangiae TaxID=2902623 RepID=UPI001E3F6E6B|nr:DUF1616 domain-containing protein [Halobacterium wangiae]
MSRVTALDTSVGDGGLLTAFGDVLVVLGYALVVGTAIVGGVATGPLRVVLAAPLLTFLPGYALAAVLFPARGPDQPTDAGTRRPTPSHVRGVSWVERVCLSFGATVALLPIVALGLSWLGFPLDTTVIVATLLLVTGVGVLGGAFRRLRLPETDRFALPTDSWRDELRAATADAEWNADTVLNVVLALLVVASMGALAFGLVAPQSGESFTEAALLGQDGGELVAGNYSTELTSGGATNFTLTVENQEGERTNYTAVAVIERVETDNGSVTVLERNELDRTSLTVPDGETREQTLSVRPEMLGDDLRFNVLLYEGEPPATVTPETADNHLFLWVDVNESSAGTAAATTAPPVTGDGV